MLSAGPVERAFVAGATGLTGREVVRALRARNVETVAHVRPGSRAAERLRPVFEGLSASVDATPWELEALTETMRRLGPTVVFALLGTTRKRAKAEDGLSAREAYERIDYGLSAMLLRAVLDAGIRPRFVYLSSIGVKEGATNPYLAVRARFERELRESGLPYTIVQPSFIVGDRDDPRPAERIGARIADAGLSLLGALGAKRLSSRLRSVDARTLGELLVEAALRPEHEGKTLRLDDLR